MLTESQLAALEKAKSEKEAHGEFESECPGYCGAQDTFYVGTMKGVGRIYQQTFIDTYAKIAFAKLYDRKTPLTAADLLNDRVVPFYDQHEVRLCRVLTDRGTEYCGNPEHHEYELYLAGRGRGPAPNQDQARRNQWNRRALPQNSAERVLPGGVPQAHLRLDRRAARDLSRPVDQGATTKTDPIRAAGVSAKPQCRPSLDATPLAKEKLIAA